MKVCYGPEIQKWVELRTDGDYDPRSISIGLVRELGGEILAGIVYEGCNGASVMAHMAATGRLTREFLWANADYAFRQLSLKKIVAPIASTNERMAWMAHSMGFKPEGLLKDAHPQGDILLMTLAKEDCRFLEGRYRGQAKTA